MQVEKLQDDIVASHDVGDAQDAQDDAVRALASARNFFFCDVWIEFLCFQMLAEIESIMYFLVFLIRKFMPLMFVLFQMILILFP